jgi:hypothetical protein
MKTHNRFRLMIFAAVLFVVSGVLNECSAKDLYLGLNLMPFSRHHGEYRNTTTNEKHNGVGLSVTTDERVSFGLMHYTNSYGRKGWSLSVTKEFESLCVFQVCPGIGGAFASAYLADGQSPILGWLQVRYKFITVITLPSVVTAVIFTVPLNR